MAHVLSVCNSFDPSASCIRAVKELQKYSKHTHEVLILNPHPHQDIYQFEEPKRFSCDMQEREIDEAFERADAVLYQFVGWERGVKRLKKPCGFRNINIYWNELTGKFYTADHYNAVPPLSNYKLLASSHVGARDFLGEPFRWLPDLLDIYAPEYTPDFAEREPCLSYIKHWASFDVLDVGARKQNLNCKPHPEVLKRRKHGATVAIDNISDGHFGLAGNELLSLAIPTVVFNHAQTREALKELAPEYPPFSEVTPSIVHAWRVACELLRMPPYQHLELRHKIRDWTEKYMNSERLIEMYWDKFVDELVEG